MKLKAEQERNAELVREIEEMRSKANAALIAGADDAKVVDYDTGLIQRQNGALESLDLEDNKAVDPAVLQESPTFVADLVCLLIAATIAAAAAEYFQVPVFVGKQI